MHHVLQIIKYCKFILFSKHKYGYGIHSPFVYSLIKEVFRDKGHYYIYDEVDKVRRLLATSKQSIKVLDLGAGSKKMKDDSRRVVDILKYSVKPDKYGRLLFRLVNYFELPNIIELGTSLGITTMYLAGANAKNNVHTIEGCPNISDIAKRNFDGLKLSNITPYTGDFIEVLPKLLDKVESVDMVFFDGNHQKIPTIKYFDLLKAKANENSIFIFDDIHWTGQMEEAWNTIKKDKEVTVTIDLFQLGLVFFKKGIAKQDFVIRF